MKLAGGHPLLDTDHQQFLLSVDPYDPSEHREFRQLIEGRLRWEIRYESIYGGEGFTVVYPQRGLISPPIQQTGHDRPGTSGRGQARPAVAVPLPAGVSPSKSSAAEGGAG
jgi:hypothetical protein